MEEEKRQIAITVDNVHIAYKGLKRTAIRASWKNFGGKIEVSHTLKGVSFEIEEGKILGILGKNGAGKSTLLRAIAGVFSPDKGRVNLHKRTVSLLSIGVGFNKKLTGKENIYLSGMLLGFTEEQIAEKEKEIIEFADIGEYIKKPVKTYSSGMYSKLAFAITAILETDIILIDEILAVGDAKFKEKSYNKMKSLIFDKKRTAIIVSHNLQTIKELCDEVIWLDDGKIVMRGSTAEVIPEYEKYMSQ